MNKHWSGQKMNESPPFDQIAGFTTFGTFCEMNRAPDVDLYSRLIYRGLYKVFAGIALVIGVIGIAGYLMYVLWVTPVDDGAVAMSEVPDKNEWVQEMRAATDMSGKYRVYNAKLDELVSRRVLSRTLAGDAKRDQTVFLRKHDSWTELDDSPDLVDVPEKGFDPRVTLSGV